MPKPRYGRREGERNLEAARKAEMLEELLQAEQLSRMQEEQKPRLKRTGRKQWIADLEEPRRAGEPRKGEIRRRAEAQQLEDMLEAQWIAKELARMHEEQRVLKQRRARKQWIEELRQAEELRKAQDRRNAEKLRKAEDRREAGERSRRATEELRRAEARRQQQQREAREKAERDARRKAEAEAEASRNAASGPSLSRQESPEVAATHYIIALQSLLGKQSFDKATTPIVFQTLPWPTLISHHSVRPNDVVDATVEAFFNRLDETNLNKEEKKALMHKSRIFWHPDRVAFRQLVQRIHDRSLRRVVEEKAMMVSKIVNNRWDTQFANT